MSSVSHFIENLFRHNITLLLPLLVLLFKFGVRWTTREPLKDVFKSLLTVPLDFIYIAVGLLFAGLARRIPQFAAKHASDRDADFHGVILLSLLFAAALVITLMDRVVRRCWQKAYAANALIREFPQLRFKDANPGKDRRTAPVGDEYLRTWFWLLFYWVTMIAFIFIELALSVVALGGILEQVT